MFNKPVVECLLRLRKIALSENLRRYCRNLLHCVTAYAASHLLTQLSLALRGIIDKCFRLRLTGGGNGFPVYPRLLGSPLHYLRLALLVELLFTLNIRAERFGLLTGFFRLFKVLADLSSAADKHFIYQIHLLGNKNKCCRKNQKVDYSE